MPSEGTADLTRLRVLENVLVCEKEENFNNSFNKTCSYVTSLSMRQKAARSHAWLTIGRGACLHCSDVTWNAGTLAQAWILSHTLKPYPSKFQP